MIGVVVGADEIGISDTGTVEVNFDEGTATEVAGSVFVTG